MNDPKKSTEAILITGPTASGKSALALALARRHGGVVINADSMQVYDTLRVITARPSLEEMEGVEHRLYGHVGVANAYSTGTWLRDIGTVLAEVRGRGLMPVIVGGTGLYFKALTGGLSDMPAISPEIRALFRQKLAQEGAQALHSHLSQVDPLSAEGLDQNDGQRIVRALEVHAATGQSIRDFQSRSGPVLVDAAKAAKYLVLPDRSILYDRIDRRFSEMMKLGAVDEVRAILAMKLPPDLPAMRAIGVSQIAAMLEGSLPSDEAVRLAATATRQYAKRQMTWFRNQMDESWQQGDAASLLSS